MLEMLRGCLISWSISIATGLPFLGLIGRAGTGESLIPL